MSTTLAQWLGALLLLRVTTLIAKLMVNSNPSLIVASLDKILPDNYLCLVESNKQQISISCGVGAAHLI